jgi:flavodoxin
MSTEIYYFSGSGNSLHVAQELQRRIPGASLIPLVSLLDKDVIKTNAETVGFVFPTHGMISPIPVRKFLKKVDLGSAEYLFAIATRGGTKFLGFPKIEKLLGKQGKRLDARFVLNMTNNDPKFEVYDIPTEEDFAKIESEVRSHRLRATPTASTAERPGRYPYESWWKTSSSPGSRYILTTVWATRSATVGIPSGRVPPSPFGISTLMTGLGK